MRRGLLPRQQRREGDSGRAFPSLRRMLRSFLVIPAKAGIQGLFFIPVLRQRLSRTLRVSDLLLALPKSRQKARRRPRCASRLSRGRLTVRPCTDSRRARVPARAPAGFSASPCNARHRECRRALLRRPSIHGLRCTERARIASCFRSVLCFCAHDARCSWVPFALRRQRPQCPKGRRDGSRRFRCQHRDVLSAEHRPRPRTFRAGCPKSAMPRACSLGYLSCTSKKGNSLVRRTSESSCSACVP